MKKIIYSFIIGLLVVISYSCNKEEDGNNVDPTFSLKIQLNYPDGDKPAADILVNLINKTDNTKFDAKTNKDGVAEFKVIAGVYEASTSETRKINSTTYIIYSGLKDITITKDWDGSKAVNLDLSKSTKSQVIVKELFVGGTPTDDKPFKYDKYVILYNNSDYEADISKLTLAIASPFNSSGSNNYYNGTSLLYESEGWIPAAQAVWYFNTNVVIPAYQQVVIALNNAVDNTTTYSQSINFANSEYYCTYDIEHFDHPKTYVAPSSAIPTTNYLSTYAYGVGTAWALSGTCPGFFIFSPKDVDLESFVNDPATTFDLSGGGKLLDQKVPVEWVSDAVEVFKSGADNQKRFTSGIDAGSVLMTSKLGYSIYRNVDKEATEAIAENEGKIVYNYSGGTEGIDDGSTDPSGIDAEASIANGAKIIYKDTNNSSNDFHQREKASLRTM